MDCERLDELAIDLVDPDGVAGLDARTRREADEHLAGCTRCRDLVDRLQRGRKASAELALEEPSSFLESRILAAASAARPKPSVPLRLVRAVSIAGRWAMRPQVAMAAVFLLMVGTSVVLLRGGGVASRRTKVTEEGTPVATLELPSRDPGGAPGLIGANDKKPDPEKPKEAKAEKDGLDLPKAAEQLAEKADKDGKNEQKEEGGEAELSAAAKTKAKDQPLESAKTLADDEAPSTVAQGALGGAKGGGGAPAAAPPPPAAAPASPPADLGYGGKADSAKKTASAGPMPAPTATAAPAGGAATGSTSSYDEAMAAYKEARYPAAAKGFEAAANAGVKPSSAWLYAARSQRAAGSCAQALPRFQRVVAGWPGSTDAAYAALEGGQCAKANGDLGTARALFEKAKASSVTQKQAEAELAALAAPPPAKAKAAKPSSAVDY